MLVGLISDTHDRLPMIDRALQLFTERKVQALIHPGDIIAPFAAKPLANWCASAAVPLYVTYGNNDGERAGLKAILPQIQDGPLHIVLDGCPILVHHFIDWCQPDDVQRAAIVVTGHTHAVSTEYRGDQLLVNPGECCGWVTGRCTVGLLDTDARSVEICELSDG